ncbi:hypothetical protein ACFLSJ_03715 [Verrucomicrobiota bacterium]
MPSTPTDVAGYEMFPRVIPEGWSGKLRLKGEYAHTKLVPGVAYNYTLKSMRWYADTKRRNAALAGAVEADGRGGLVIPFEPDAPGEWVLEVTSEDQSVRALPTLGLYVNQPAHHGLRPYIGDLHAHSTGSDGRQEPAYVAIRAREVGYDFFALTDHGNFKSSGEMVRKARGKLGNRMLLMRGEELHMDGCYFHYVGIGHKHGMEDFRRKNEATWRREVAKIVRELKGRATVPRLDLKIYAEGVWKVRRVKAQGGLVLFSHPYWSWGNSLFIDEAHREQTFLDREFDAVEAISAVDRSFTMSNRMAATPDEARPLPVVGVSDSHSWYEEGTGGTCWTYVLAEELTQASVFDAIRAGRSLACEKADNRVRLVGPFEFVDFADFYHRKLLPIKRRSMELEARLAFSALRGAPYDRGLVERLDESLARLERKLWA